MGLASFDVVGEVGVAEAVLLVEMCVCWILGGADVERNDGFPSVVDCLLARCRDVPKDVQEGVDVSGSRSGEVACQL